MNDRISNLNMEVSGIYIYKNNHMVLDMDKIISNIIDDLKAENNDLKIELELLQGGDEQGLILSNQLRDVEIKELKAEIKSYIKAREGRINTIDDLKAEIKELKENSKKQYPKEYKAEAEEYFHHNPQAEKVLFYMLDNNERCIDYDTLEQYEIACIDNDNI